MGQIATYLLMVKKFTNLLDYIKITGLNGYVYDTILV